MVWVADKKNFSLIMPEEGVQAGENETSNVLIMYACSNVVPEAVVDRYLHAGVPSTMDTNDFVPESAASKVCEHGA